jgi:hypothetical protein
MEVTQHSKYTCVFCGKVGSHLPDFLNLQIISGQHETTIGRHLALQKLQEDRRRRRVCVQVGVRDAVFIEHEFLNVNFGKSKNSFSTTTAATVRSTIRRLREGKVVE